MNILILGSRGDPVIVHFLNFISKNELKECKFIFIDQDQFGKSVHLTDKRWFFSKNKSLDHNDIHGVWNRLLTNKFSNKCLDSCVYRNIVAYCYFLMDEVYPKVLSRPKDAMSNCAKLYQSSILSLKNIKFTESVIFANVIDVVLGNPSKWIFKSMSGVRSIVKPVADSSFSKGRRISVSEPVLFQRRIDGDNIRVHVIGEEVFSTRCRSNVLDYRYGDTKLDYVDIPHDIKKECITISVFLNLPFVGIDLILKNSEYTFLEANPAPGYCYFEDSSYPISSALARYWE